MLNPLVTTLADKLSKLHLLQAAGIAEGLACSDQARAAAWGMLSQLCVNYHSALLQTVDLTRSLPTLILAIGQGVPECSGLARALSIEVDRVNAAFGRALESDSDTIRVQFILAYYGLIIQDGIRASLWLHRALLSTNRLTPLPPRLRALCTDLRDTVLTALDAPGFDSSTMPEHVRTQSLYESFQAAADYLNRFSGLDYFAEIDVFRLRLAEDSNIQSLLTQDDVAP